MEKGKKEFTSPLHRQQIFWQVWVPLIGGIFIVLILSILFFASSSSNVVETGRFADISIILITIPFLIVFLFFLTFFALLIFGIYKLTVVIPQLSFKLYMYVVIACDFVRLWSDRIVAPLITTRSWLSKIGRIFSIFNPHLK